MDNVKVMISIPRPFLEVVDQAAREDHRNRSELFREAARLYLQVRASGRRPIDDPRVRQAVALMDQLAQRDQPTPGWDVVEAVRAGRERGRGG
jgi:metal-responsive CopG/Arc/MetJ family transcriptional regulator